MDLNALLTQAELEAYRRHMAGGQYGDGSPEQEKAAAASITRMLELLVTKAGRNAVGALGPGRGSILSELIAVLLGPAPDPQAWIEAIARGSFDLTGYKAYGKRPKTIDGKQPAIGSPGNFLPRLLERYQKAAGRRPANAKEMADLRTALGILIATSLLKELHNVTNERAALGSAWPLVSAVSGRQHTELRRVIAGYGDDPSFRHQLAADIQRSVIDWAKRHPGRVLPTNKQVDSQAQQTDIEQHFANEAISAERRKNALIAFGKILLSGDSGCDDPTIDAVLGTLRDEPAYAWLRDMPRHPVAADYPGGVSPMPTELLRQFMPVAAGPSTTEQVLGRAAMAPIAIMSPRPLRLTESKMINKRLDDLARSIHTHVETKGLPPMETPIEHLAMFEASVCYWSLNPDWEARQPWEDIGFNLHAPSPEDEDAAYRLWDMVTSRAETKRTI